MIAKIWSAAVRGIEGHPVSVELDLANGLPRYSTVGLPDNAVRESRERVSSALRNSGYDFPPRRITVNLSPAEFRKRGTQFDLPVALGVLAATGQVRAGDWMGRYCVLGELALDGGVQSVSGVLPMAAAALEAGLAGVILPKANAAEAAATGIASYGVSTLREALAMLAGEAPMVPEPPSVPGPELRSADDLRDVKGQAMAKRAMEIAAAGGHHILLIGPPGAGKSMLARRLPGLLPPPEEGEALEILKLRSIARAGAAEPPARRPFRAPHHTVTPQTLVGGGSTPRPGEVSLAHGGVLFLDELPEFRREALEALRVPLETHRAAVNRLKDSVEYPACFMLAAAMNPCPCGWRGHPRRACTCAPGAVARYRARLSGPLLDRIDLHVGVGTLGYEEWRGGPGGEPSSEVRARVCAARRRQAERLGPGRTNAEISPSELRGACRMTAGSLELLGEAASRLALSARSLDRVAKVARTAADLEGAEETERRHLAEALALSGRERPGMMETMEGA